ncbi:hypothetical protein, partial [Rhodobacter sp. NSM]|uniref:hypothetical protein n=1 Tax=Rhodobacter sp. NSM TaxID=3457501 RepID=UPI003FD3DBA8
AVLRITDLHIWRLGPGHHGAIVTLRTPDPREGGLTTGTGAALASRPDGGTLSCCSSTGYFNFFRSGHKRRASASFR